MSDIYWANPVSGQFNVGTNWVGGMVPTESDEAVLDSSGIGYVVTDTTNQNVFAIEVGAGVTLQIAGSGVRFSSYGGLNGTSTSNSGTIDIGVGAIFTLGGIVDNTGIIMDEGELGPHGLTLSGGGTVEFENNYSQIRDTYGYTFKNLDNTIITGTGNGLIRVDADFTNGTAGSIIQTTGHKIKIDMGHQHFRNYGLVQAQGVGSLTILTSGAGYAANNGTIESSGGTITIKGYAGNNIGGVIESAGGRIVVEGSVFNNGVIQSIGGDIVVKGNLINNLGVIETANSGVVVVQGNVANNGLIETFGGSIEAKGDVTGPGSVEIMGGKIKFDGAFSQSVTFGATGILALAEANHFKAAVTGFSTGNAFDLTRIGLVSANEATFKGTAAGGRLTVTDGLHTARIALSGDYLGATFIAASDGAGGVIITEAIAAAPGPASPGHFAAAAASLGPAPAIASALSRGPPRLAAPILTAPHGATG